MITPERTEAGLARIGYDMACAPDEQLVQADLNLPEAPVEPEPPIFEQRGNRRRRLVQAGLALASVALSVPAEAQADVYVNNPHGTHNQQQIIYDKMIQEIDATKAGATIMIQNPTMDKAEADSAIRADARGVHVQAVLAAHGPGHTGLTRSGEKLVKALGTNVHDGSFVHVCEHGCNAANRSSIMHAKNLYISKVHGHPLTMITSADLVPRRGNNVWNTAYSTTSPKIFAHEHHTFRTLLDTKPQGFEGGFNSGNIEVTDFPQPKSTPKDNYFTRLLQPVECRRNNHSTNTHVELATYIFSKYMKPVAWKMVKLHRQGCDTKMILYSPATPPSIIHILKKNHVPYRFSDHNGVWMHDKVVAIRGLYSGRRVSTVASGSLNVSIQAMKQFDETMIRVKNSKHVYNAYMKQLTDAWHRGVAKPQRGAHKVLNDL